MSSILRSPNDWSCLLVSAAMAFDCDLKDITDFLGHDGSEQSPNGHRRGFHIQEIIRFAQQEYLWILMPLEPVFGIQTQDGHIFRGRHEGFVKQTIEGRKAILEGHTPRCGHACYWDGYHVADPRGHYSPDDFTITTWWLII